MVSQVSPSLAVLWIVVGEPARLVSDSPPRTGEAWGELVLWMRIVIMNQNYISRLVPIHTEAMSQGCVGTSIVWVMWDTSWKVNAVARDVFLQRNVKYVKTEQWEATGKDSKAERLQEKIVLLTTPSEFWVSSQFSSHWAPPCPASSSGHRVRPCS